MSMPRYGIPTGQRHVFGNLILVLMTFKMLCRFRARAGYLSTRLDRHSNPEGHNVRVLSIHTGTTEDDNPYLFIGVARQISP